jgi:pyridoxamine 5'-phosphate oxidase family protein
VSVFTQDELEYLRGQSLSRVATVGPDGQPHVTPVTFHYNEAEDTIDVGGMFFGGTKKWRDAQGNQHVTILIDDVIPKPRQARAIEVRGTAELHETGGETVNPRFANFAPQFFRIRPTRIVSWGIEKVAAAADAQSFQMNARSVR